MRTIHSATRKFATAAMCSTAGASNPAAASRAAAAAPPTLDREFMMLLAAIMRDRSDGRALSWMIAYRGTEKMPPDIASRNKSTVIRQPGQDASASDALPNPPAALAAEAAEAKSQQKTEMPSAAKGASRGD